MKKLIPVLFIILLAVSGCIVYQAPAPTPAIAMQTAMPEPTPEPKVFSYSEFVDNLPLYDYWKNKTLETNCFTLEGNNRQQIEGGFSKGYDIEERLLKAGTEFIVESKEDHLLSIETRGLTHSGYQEEYFRTQENRENNKVGAKKHADDRQAFFSASIEEVFSAMQKADFITKKEETELFNAFAEAYENERSTTAQVGPVYASYTIVGDAIKITIVFEG